MKLKEFPRSLVSAFRLQRLPVDCLSDVAESQWQDCIVSLTSIESRLSVVHLTVRSLLRQSLKPDKIVLWLHHDLESRVPKKLSELLCSHFEIRYSEQACSHHKLVESLKVYSEKVIVTCDDDLMYSQDWLYRLWVDHKAFPADVIAHECRKIMYSELGELKSYKDWHSEEVGEGSLTTVAIGYGGVVYPPGCLHPDVLVRELYDWLAPRADDLWFKAMSLRQGTLTRRSTGPYPKPLPVVGSQKVSLKKHNIGQDGNRTQWQSLCNYFQLKSKLLVEPIE